MSDDTEDRERQLRVTFYKEQREGRDHLNNSAFEHSLQAFNNCLHMCDTIPSLAKFKYEVLGNIGWLNRFMGRYDIAIQYLKDAISLADSLPGPPTPERIQIEGELGTVYRLADRHEEAREVFTRQYALAKKQLAAPSPESPDDYYDALLWKRVACRAVGNLAMANYRRALQLLSESENPNGKEIKQKTKDRIHQAISQLEERIRLTNVIEEETSTGGHGGHSRIRQVVCWRGIALSRLSLCHTALADLESSDDAKMMHLKKAVDFAEQGSALSLWESSVTLSRFFHGRALLRWARHQQQNTTSSSADEPYVPESYRKQILDNFGPKALYTNPYNGSAVDYKIATPAIAFAMEPSTEHKGYLRELVDAGADFESIDPTSGYTALDYAVYSGDVETQEIVIEGLRAQYRARTGKTLPSKQIEYLKQEARLRKGYREIFQEKLRPELMKGREGVSPPYLSDDETEARDRVVRRRALRGLRRVYADALSADKEMGDMFDRLKVIKYKDFVEFGRLPRSSDGLAMDFDVAVGDDGMKDEAGVKDGGGDGHDDEGEFVIFFSYRWINTDPSLNSPDDANRTQYKRMIDAAESYLESQDGLVSRDKLFIWMDFACVDQDNPSAGVSALPLIIAQCDAVITLLDSTYFTRAWCCVEVAMIQTLRGSYHLHEWLQQVPTLDNNDKPTDDEDSSYGIPTDDEYKRENEGTGDEDRGQDEGATNKRQADTRPRAHDTAVRQWQLQRAKDGRDLSMEDAKLSYETDRPKVLFLERQTRLLRWSW